MDGIHENTPDGEVMIDPFTQKSVVRIFTDKTTLPLQLAEEFGSRVGWAMQQGLAREVAIESCRIHFKNVGDVMVNFADIFAEQALVHLPAKGEEK